MSNNINELYGDYSTIPVIKYVKTPYIGLRSLADRTILAPGCKDNTCTKYDDEAVKSAAQGADVVVVCLGTGYYPIIISHVLLYYGLVVVTMSHLLHFS